ncbi:CNNM domain-containing protein [Algoriphagus persicinus]|uniref:CNNM domain-containing protein n=1 Tax=Algoriphagus persicinus TaxID=3108754 RepID=UPI002B36C545|nr:CNNM domain-containing protein [Algoriphagus sp. E1-3-M2]MEB2783809.1 CNNM domain-containing protein [Algoriphagus sp. E1-3-M2]
MFNNGSCFTLHTFILFKIIIPKWDKGAETMLKLKEDIDKPLSAILSLKTVAHTVCAAGVRAQATVVFGEAFFGIVSAGLTVLLFVLTEIIPKTLGANYSRELVSITARIIKEVMTPRIVVIKANEEITLQEFLKNKEFLHFSRIPIYHDNRDNITGYIFRELVF